MSVQVELRLHQAQVLMVATQHLDHSSQSAVAQVQVALSIFLVLLVVQVVAQVLLVRHVQ
jgi:hypothetical protein